MCKKGVKNRGRKRVFLAVLFAKAACSSYLCTVNEVVRPSARRDWLSRIGDRLKALKRQAEPLQGQAENGDYQLYNGP